MATPAETLRDQRRAQIARDRAVARDLTLAYRTILDAARRDLLGITTRIADAQAAGVAVNADWLLREARLEAIIADLQRALRVFGLAAGQTVDQAVGASAVQGTLEADQLLQTVLPPGFQVPTAAPDAALVAATARSQLIGAAVTLAGHADATVQAVRDLLLEGVGLGKSPRAIATHLRRQLQAPYWQALRLARTETITAYRDAAVHRYQDSGVVRNWVWLAKLDGRTCPVCIAMSGTIHPLDEKMASHPNCRCTPAPLTKTWAELGFPGLQETRIQPQLGDEWFRRQPRALQLQILGPTKLAAYENGDLQLSDLVARTTHPVWGPGRRERSLGELELQPARAAAPPPPTAPLAESLRLPGRSIHAAPLAAIRETAAALDELHTVRPGMRTVPVKIGQLGRGVQGRYRYRDSTGPVDLVVDPSGTHPHLTFAHEVGHYLDHEHLAEGRGDASMQALPKMARWREAAYDSRLMQHLNSIRTSTPDGVSPRSWRRYVDYLLQGDETFARSYAQWAALRTGSRQLIEQVDAARVSTAASPPTQWAPDDFEAIAAALDELFGVQSP